MQILWISPFVLWFVSVSVLCISKLLNTKGSGSSFQVLGSGSRSQTRLAFANWGFTGRQAAQQVEERRRRGGRPCRGRALPPAFPRLAPVAVGVAAGNAQWLKHDRCSICPECSIFLLVAPPEMKRPFPPCLLPLSWTGLSPWPRRASCFLVCFVFTGWRLLAFFFNLMQTGAFYYVEVGSFLH